MKERSVPGPAPYVRPFADPPLPLTMHVVTLPSMRVVVPTSFASLLTPSALPRLLLLGLFLCASLPATAQDREREQREVASFTEIAYSLPGTLHLRQGDEQSVEIEASSEDLEKIETTIDGETLEIRSEHQSSWLSWLFDTGDELSGTDIDVYVTAPTVKSLSLAGTGNVVGETPLEGASLEVDIAGTGGLDLTLDVQDLEINIAGSGTTRLEGYVGTADVSIAGSGNVYLPEVDTLSASIAGSGNVRYSGDPQIESSIFGSGVVRAREQRSEP